MVGNDGTIGGNASATEIGTQAREEVDVPVHAASTGFGVDGSAPQSATVPAYQPTAVGDVTWTATVDDGDPGVDEATATPRVW